MNKTPSILVDTGYVTDQNGVLTEIVIPSVVTTLDPPKKIVFNGTALNYIPSTAEALEEFRAPNVTDLVLTNSKSFYNCSALTSVDFPALETMTDAHNSPAYTGGFSSSGITSVNFPKLKTISISNAQTFHNCNLTAFNAPELETILFTATNAYPTLLYENNGITTLNLPKLKNTSGGGYAVFFGCTGLETVTLGSIGHPVSSLQNNMFYGCTQQGLTITIYTQGGAALAGEPWGATNATIEYEEA